MSLSGTFKASPPKQPSFKPTLGGISEGMGPETSRLSTLKATPPKQPSFKPTLGGISEGMSSASTFATFKASPSRQPSFRPTLSSIGTSTTTTAPLAKTLPTEIQGKVGALTAAQTQNLQKTYDESFPQSGFSFDRDSGQTYRILYRGCTTEQLIAMASTGSAGGVAAKEDTPKPTEMEARLQVGELASFSEFTTDLDIARRFGTNNYVIAVKINVNYLTRGSVTEKGHICNKSAPVELLAWEKGRVIALAE